MSQHDASLAGPLEAAPANANARQDGSPVAPRDAVGTAPDGATDEACYEAVPDGVTPALPERRPSAQHRFASHDGVELVYRHWPAAHVAPAARRGIVLFHRGHEHAGRIAHLVDELALPDVDFFAWDARGHGESPGERGDSPGFAHSVRDIQSFVSHIGERHGIRCEALAVVAQSVGAVLAATWVHDYAPPIRALVLASPAFDIKLYVPLAKPGLRLLHALRGNFFINSYVKPRLLTHDAARVASYQTDPLIARAISVRMLLGLYDAARRVVADAQAIHAPTQLLISGSDFVVHRKPQDRFFDRLGTTRKERHVLPGFFHDTLGERDRAPAVAAVRRFVLTCFDTPATGPDLRDADRIGPMRAEADALATPLRRGSPADLYWRTTRASLRLAATVSAGVRLGIETGFDSGSTLDYVYRNEPGGRGGLGGLIDKQYLNSIGWRGIRQRKVHLEAMLAQACNALRAHGMPVHIMDIAAGHGRYVLDAVQRLTAPPDSVLLRDYSEINVREGRALIAARQLGAIARFEAGNAFDRQDLAARSPRPTVAVVSGLYELFSDNRLVSTSLAGLAEAVPADGYLVYTGQPWHPQLAFIARALTSHRGGQAWVMRRRTQAELDQLVAAAGFEKIDMRIDQWGIFTVSVARRR
ncbi:bifunctional alpha/beta hydrolase/class I SAM-dependent methyltransferase [Chitinasiproducens palmae]|uniref:Lysophospholipase, alpha-beta hydrolase superfamily n=1 Tax=Chitinasiproducens palmae TaxID=1770053 RepID=A0A1H2PIR6_9BURK|nr:bifunctional alpha/beta hydrolase/class I SAM-dependent methyltransferase [Chitinasiproducens palmae]SDV46145.1 Lysophospholipase, alpha-beta hydrolase superfamily [Chitinasiproducens palmae]